MLRHYLAVVLRGLVRSKGSSVINIISLATGLVTVLFIYLWVIDELSIDNFHVNKQLFQVYENRTGSGDIYTSPTTPAIMGESLMSDIPEVAHAINVSWSQYATLTVKDKNVKSKGYYAGERFFDMFSYNLIRGGKQVLTDINSIVISESLALKLFNSIDSAIGQGLEVKFEKTFANSQNQIFNVSGVYANVPQNSSDQFDFILPFQVYWKQNDWLSNWEVTATRTFVLLRPDAEADKVSQKLADYIRLKTNQQVTHRTPFLKKYSEIYLYSEYKNGAPFGGRIAYVKLFVFVGIFIMVIACMNFMNLSTARITGRLKEVSVRKIVGASRISLIVHCMLEAFVICVLAAFIALPIVHLLLPEVNKITSKNMQVPYNHDFFLSVLSIVVAMTLLGGSYPSMYISSLHPKMLLRGRFSSTITELWARKGLVVFQFSLSAIFIASILIIYSQLNFVQSVKLGYEKDNIVYFVRDGRLMEDEHLVAFLDELRNIASVVEASSISHDLTGHNSGTTKIVWEGKSAEDNTEFERIVINHRMLETLGIELKSGRAFSKNFPSDNKSIVFNETAIKKMGLKDPIGKTIQLEGEDFHIIGIVKDFNFESLHHSIKPVFFKLAPEQTRLIMVKILNGQEDKAVSDLQQLYNKHNPGFSFDYHFLEDEYRFQYDDEQRISSLSMYFAVLAIVISCLGLIGLSAYMTEKRKKEVGIRKIHGANVLQIINMLAGDFTKLAFASIMIGIPIAYFVLNSWLNGFAYRIALEWWYFAVAGVSILTLSLLTVGIHTINAANINPVNHLKHD